jgi:hypothetical protein
MEPGGVTVSLPPGTHGYKFLVNGTDWQVRNSIKAIGFNKIRLESYTGGHDPYPPHTTEALNWFVAESWKNTPARRDSDFDKFFKKKPL